MPIYAAPEQDAMSVSEFSRRHGICKATLYNLWRQGNGPRFMQIGRRRLISVEAAESWRAEMVRKAEAQVSTA